MKLLGGILIVGGTAIGAGMLALPVTTAVNGFYPSIIAFFVVYIFSMATGLLFLELCLAMPKNANIISMARHYLGPIGQFFAWILYIMLFYCLIIAYVDGGSSMVEFLSEGTLSKIWAMLIFVVIFSTVLYLGTGAVDSVNRVLMLGLIVTFLFFTVFAFQEINMDNFSHFKWHGSLFTLPVIFTSFSYQGTLPSLMQYLDRNKKAMQYSIVIGITLPFLIYVLWQFLVMGVVPLSGPHGLLEAKSIGETAVYSLHYFVRNKYIAAAGQVFGFFALASSLLGVSLGLMDFLSDGLKIEKIGWKKVFLCALIFIPPMLITHYNPGIFLLTLGYAGGIGCAILLGLYPALMVWRARYRMANSPAPILWGGKPMLILIVAFVVLELGLEVVKDFKLFGF